jgi:hypothetical protein
MIIFDGFRSRALVALVMTCTIGRPAHAQAEDEAAARALFSEARALMKTGDYEHACPKLEAAKTMYAGPGVLLNLGDCYEHFGKTASAWAMFSDAITTARRADRRSEEVEAEATARRNALEPKLTKLLITVDPAAAVTVMRDGRPLSQGAWNVAIPVDAGPHTIAAEATGKRSWKTDVTTTEPGSTVNVVVARLEPVEAQARVLTPPPPIVQPHPAVRVQYWTSLRIAAATIAGAGVVTVGVSGIIGFVARAQFDTAANETFPARHVDSSAAYDLGNVGTVIAIAGGVLAVTGVVLWIAAPSKRVVIGASTTGVVVGGAW